MVKLGRTLWYGKGKGVGGWVLGREGCGNKGEWGGKGVGGGGGGVGGGLLSVWWWVGERDKLKLVCFEVGC